MSKKPGGVGTDQTKPRLFEPLLLAGLFLFLVGWFLWPFIANDAAFPLGPDTPVYLWWTRLAGEEGLSAVGHRPGVPAISLVLEGALGLSVVDALAALEVALGVAVGLASASLVRGWRTRTDWVLAGLLAGTFAVHLAVGYMANHLVAAAFLAAAVSLAGATKRSTGVAAALLGAGGFAHPIFFVLCAVILGLTAAMASGSDRSEATRVMTATVAGGAVAGGGFLLLLIGPMPLDVDTSKDGFLRRIGLTAELRNEYFDRFKLRWTRYAQWVSIPLAAVGVSRTGGFVGRLLRAWGLILALGVVASLATRLFPADRFIRFGLVVPILAALGVVKLVQWIKPRWIGIAVGAALTLEMLVGAFLSWHGQEPFMTKEEVSSATVANRYVATAPRRTIVVFIVNDTYPEISSLATRAANVLRATMPPDRIRDLFVLVPESGNRDAGIVRTALTSAARDDIAAAHAARGPDVEELRIVLEPFDRSGFVTFSADSRYEQVSDQVVIRSPADPLPEPQQPLVPSSPGRIAVSSALVLAFVTITGLGWARISVSEMLNAAAAAPAFGVSLLVLSAVALERLGLPIDTSVGAWIVSAAAGGGGYFAWVLLERGRRRDR